MIIRHVFSKLQWELHKRKCSEQHSPVKYPIEKETRKSATKVLILSHDNDICRSQIHPFFFYRKQLFKKYSVSISEQNINRFSVEPTKTLERADIVMLQPWYDIGDDGLNRLIDNVRNHCKPSRIVFLDSYAPTDLRFANTLNDQIDLYLKKHVLKDRSLYGKSTLGDTNLTDYAAKKHSLNLPKTTFPIPANFLDKLIIGPSFFTADYLLGKLYEDRPFHHSDMFDIHARLGTKGAPFYQLIRGEALKAVGQLNHAAILKTFPVKKRQYLQELSRSRLCFSPFGYGEVAWRDYEAIILGSTLLKQDCSHLETYPDIFRSGESYVSLKWDFSDFNHKVHHFLDNSEDRQRIAINAFQLLSTYAKNEEFVTQMAPIFSD